jgi:hypothetical protein
VAAEGQKLNAIVMRRVVRSRDHDAEGCCEVGDKISRPGVGITPASNTSTPAPAMPAAIAAEM